MSKEIKCYISSEEISEPLELEETISIEYTIKNIGDEAAEQVGFYLKSASTLGDIDFLSSFSPAVNFLKVIEQGDEGYGLTITQGLTTTRFCSNVGDNYDNRIPLIIGTGSNLNEIEPNAEIVVTIEINFKPGTSAANYYVDLVVA